MEWFGEFFRAMPDVGRAFYQFFDPASLGRGWVGGLITLLWIGPLMVLPALAAKHFYGKREWMSATFGCIAAGSFLWWITGVIPHMWIQFVESNENILAGVVIPESFGFTVNGTRIDVASNLYAVISDSVVAVLMIASIVLGLWMVLRMQKQYPKTLAAGETKPEAGGYK
ncbi:hypothetical protein FTX61_03150 [Nitriliruptoraceae bacterium ZYF776]|nr:hypothetical protein [Profundirhabdus halotolerans]